MFEERDSRFNRISETYTKGTAIGPTATPDWVVQLIQCRGQSLTHRPQQIQKLIKINTAIIVVIMAVEFV